MASSTWRPNTRIFPELFEIVALDGGATEPSPGTEQVISEFHQR